LWRSCPVRYNFMHYCRYTILSHGKGQ
jgi:hypothetical protein